MRYINKKFVFSDISRWIKENKKSFYKIVLILIVLMCALVVKINNADAKEIAAEDKTSKAQTGWYVDISGGVKSPGIYEVDSETRLFDVIKLAGGIADDADIDQINQAEFIKDGQKIIIPTKNENEAEGSSLDEGSSSNSDGTVNINSASKDELKTIAGVGDVIAERIIDYRKGSRFNSIEDIKNVKGIGDATYEKMKDSITI
jgi:competence protein ComEA